MSENQLYEIVTRKVGYTTFLSIVCKRGDVYVQSSEKVIPPIIEYDADGNFSIIGPKAVIGGLVKHPYKALSSDFNEARLADLEVAALYKQLEHFPTLPRDYSTENEEVHPVAELLYSNIVYLKPLPELAKKLGKMGYIKKTKILPTILEKVANKLKEHKGINLDLFSVPKRDVGTFAYLADDNGIASLAKVFNFGMEHIIPPDRRAREWSSLKSCDRFVNPEPVPYDIPDAIRPYVTTLRVAIVGTKESMLDSGDLFPSSIKKLACNLVRKKVEKDVALIPMDERNLVYRPFRSGIEVFHEEVTSVNEETNTPGGIRLVFPGGVKIAAQVQKSQAVDEDNNPIDLLLSFETFANKGAIACFLFGHTEQIQDIDHAIELFQSLEREKIYLENTEYEGYVVTIPVMRPGQRYTELAKPSQVTVDFIARAILSKEYKVPESLEREFKELVGLRHSIIKEIERTK